LSATPLYTDKYASLNCRRAGGRTQNFALTVFYSADNEIAFSMNYILDEDEVTVQDSNNSRKQYIDSNTKSKGTVKVSFDGLVFCLMNIY
jgi:hypothetical protein